MYGRWASLTLILFPLFRMESLLRNFIFYPVIKNGAVLNVAPLGNKKYIIVHCRSMITDPAKLEELDWTMISFFQIKDASWIILPKGISHHKMVHESDVLLKDGSPMVKDGREIGMVYYLPGYEITIFNDPKEKLGGRQYHKNNSLFKCVDTFRCVIKRY